MVVRFIFWLSYQFIYRNTTLSNVFPFQILYDSGSLRVESTLSLFEVFEHGHLNTRNIGKKRMDVEG
jgi:hypothetical protein